MNQIPLDIFCRNSQRRHALPHAGTHRRESFRDWHGRISYRATRAQRRARAFNWSAPPSIAALRSWITVGTTTKARAKCGWERL